MDSRFFAQCILSLRVILEAAISIISDILGDKHRINCQEMGGNEKMEEINNPLLMVLELSLMSQQTVMNRMADQVHHLSMYLY